MNIEYIINSCLDSIKELYQFEFHVFDMRGMREKDLNLLSVLSEKELEYLDTLKNVKNRIQWISGRYAVKTALFKYKLDRGALMDLSCIDVLKEKDSSGRSEPGRWCNLYCYPAVRVSLRSSNEKARARDGSRLKSSKQNLLLQRIIKLRQEFLY